MLAAYLLMLNDTAMSDFAYDSVPRFLLHILFSALPFPTPATARSCLIVTIIVIFIHIAI